MQKDKLPSFFCGPSVSKIFMENIQKWFYVNSSLEYKLQSPCQLADQSGTNESWCIPPIRNTIASYNLTYIFINFWWIENRNSFFLLVIWTRLAKWEVWYYCTFFYKSVRMLVNLNFYVKVFHACSSYDIHFASITKQIKLVFDISLLVFAKTNLFQISKIEICKSKYLQMFQTF